MTDKPTLKEKVPGDILTDPEALATAQGNDDPKINPLVAYFNLPAHVKRRVKALKKLQFESLKVEAEFYRQMNELEREFQKRYDPLFEKRRHILVGEFEPSAEECDWPENLDVTTEGEAKPEAAGTGEQKETDKLLAEGDAGDKKDSPNGIPDFWLTIFNNVPLLAENKEESDDPILQALQDIQCHINPPDSRPGFYLEFHFGPNDYFTNSILKKEYFIRFDPAAIDPLGFEGPEIVESKGSTVNWKPGKNVTVKTVKKTMKHKNRGEKKTISKTVKTNSFFNFFDPPKGCIDNLPEDADEEEDIEIELQADFELGQFFREQIIPRAVLYFTGEAVDDEDDDFEDDVDDEEDEDEDDDDDEHDHEHAHDRPHGRTTHRQRNNSNNQQPECKQQ